MSMAETRLEGVKIKMPGSIMSTPYFRKSLCVWRQHTKPFNTDSKLSVFKNAMRVCPPPKKKVLMGSQKSNFVTSSNQDDFRYKQQKCKLA